MSITLVLGFPDEPTQILFYSDLYHDVTWGVQAGTAEMLPERGRQDGSFFLWRGCLVSRCDEQPACVRAHAE